MNTKAKSAVPFKVEIPQYSLDAIMARVRAFDWDSFPDAGGWSAGASLPFMRDLCAYWTDSYDWRAQEAVLNSLPHFKCDGAGLDLHCVHLRGQGPAPLPLLLTHGWPGSFFEFMHIAERLADPTRFGGDAKDAFHVIIPSLPGYGFSQRPAQPIGPRQVARHFASLMRNLGYMHYVAQGGDWGSSVSSWLGYDDPACIGVHLNMISAIAANMKAETQAEKDYAAHMRSVMDAEGAYFRLQSTKPQSLAFAMMDSPVGVAAWIIEKFAAWSDLPRTADGSPDLLARYTRDQLLTNIMIYLVTKSFATASWLYRGRLLERDGQFPVGTKLSKPVALTAFADPTFRPMPRSQAEKGFNVVQWSEPPHGGHFAALEAPDALVADVTKFARTLR